MKPIAVCFSVLLACSLPEVKAAGSIRFAGEPVELAISEVSDRALRIELTPLNDQGTPLLAAQSGVLVPFPTTERLRVRERALWLHYPDDPQAVKLGDEYLWGRDLLVAPVIEKGARSRHVYLPRGVWVDWWTGEKLTGGRWVDRSVDLSTLPLYARAGAIIPLDPVRQFTSQPVTEPTTIRVFPGADGKSTLYDDDGASPGYQDGSDPRMIRFNMVWDDSRRVLTIETSPGTKAWQGGTRRFNIAVIGLGAAPKPVSFSGTHVEVSF
jgi:alpha-glucosidase